MRRRLVFGPVAEDEVKEAIAWYEQQQKGLGKRVRISIREAFNRIRRLPEVPAIVFPPDVRKVLVKTFPYVVFYRVLADQIRVVSVFHASRHLDGWMRAIDDDIASN